MEQIAFSGAYANKTGQPVLYITEYAVFELRKDGVYLTEVAPGIAIFVAVCSGLPILESLQNSFMPAAGDYVINYFLIFFVGALFGAVYQFTGAAESIARAIAGVSKGKFAAPILMCITGLLTFGGVSGFIVFFVICVGPCGSACGGMGVAFNALKDTYISMGLNLEYVHRIATIAAGTLDTLPHQGTQMHQLFTHNLTAHRLPVYEPEAGPF